MTLSEYLKAYRKVHDLSQRQFAANCGVSNGYISMLEKGENPKTGEPITPTPQTVQAIAKGMGMTMQELFLVVDDLYLDLTSEGKQPSRMDGLSADTLEIAEIIEALPANLRRVLLLQARALKEEQLNRDTPAGSP